MTDKNNASKHFGSIGERSRWLACYVDTKSFVQPNYHTGKPETRYVHRFEVDGNQAVWFTGTKLELERGEQVIVVGTIKEYKTFMRVQQTVLTRCDIAPVILCDDCGAALLAKDKKCPACKAKPSQTELFGTV